MLFSPLSIRVTAASTHSPLRGWLPLPLLPLMVVFLEPTRWPRWAFMWPLSAAIFFGCKWLTWRRRPPRISPIWRTAGYFLAWPGLDAPAFFDPTRQPAKPLAGEWLVATAKMSAGFILLFVVAARVPARHAYCIGWIGMISIVMILHFGAFHLLSCMWRSIGVDARPLMNWPGASVRLADFWGRRWNTAFRDLTHRFLFRPLVADFGARGALAVGFVTSGLIHDAVISCPAGGGYGGPTLYFLLQAVGLFAERSAIGRWLRVGAGLRGWLFTMAFLVLPVPLLFHRPFVIGIIIPFMHAMGAI